MAQLAVLLATYNGEKYLEALLDSVLAQTEQDFDMLVSDDCSGDRTVAILREYARKYPRISILENSGRYGSAKANFFSLLQRAKGYRYVMTCDQDDVWEADKIAKTLEKMREIEGDSPQTPCLVHTDLSVVDGNLQPIAPSFVRYAGFDPVRCELRHLLVQNCVTGCAMMLNESLRRLGAYPKNMESIPMHDGWFAILAAARGKIGYVDEALIRYRQHDGNSVGAKDAKRLSAVMRLAVRAKQNRASLQATMRQAQEALACAPEDNILRDYAAALHKGKIGKLRVVIKHGIWKCGWKRCIGEILYL